MKKNFKMRLLAIISIICLCIGVTLKNFQNDTFYIIKLGEYIFHNGIDLIDHYCWITNLSYTYPHWLYDVIMYLIYANFNFSGIYVSTILLFIILILSIYVVNLKFNKNEFLAWFVSVISIVCLYGFATARAQLVTAILFLWQVYFMEKLIKCGSKRYIIYLVLVSWLVANLHATIWMFCFILYLPFLLEYFICVFANFKFSKDKFRCIFENSKISIKRNENIKKLFISFILSFLTGLFTPSRICYSYVFRIMMGNSQSYIIEHFPMIVIEHPCFVVILLVLLLALIFGNVKIKLRELFMIGGLVIMSLFSVRHVALFYIIGVLYICIFLNRYLKEKNDRTFEVLGKVIINHNFIYYALIIGFLFISMYQFHQNFRDEYVPRSEYPVDAVDFVKNNLDVDQLHLYNSYNIGSYLLFNDIPVFIDSRCDLYLREFNGLDYSIFDDAMEIAYNYEEKFEFYGVTHVLIHKNNIFYTILLKDENYNIIYKDKNFGLFEKVLNHEEKE